MRGAYLFDGPRDDNFFRFEPMPISLGVIRGGDCGEILYPNTIRDLMTSLFGNASGGKSRSGGAETAGDTSPSPDASRQSLAAASARPGNSAGVPRLFRSGRRAAGATRYFRNTAGSTSGASPGSRPEKSRRTNLPLGTKRPRPEKRTATGRSFPWRSSQHS